MWDYHTYNSVFGLLKLIQSRDKITSLTKLCDFCAVTMFKQDQNFTQILTLVSRLHRLQ